MRRFCLESRADPLPCYSSCAVSVTLVVTVNVLELATEFRWDLLTASYACVEGPLSCEETVSRSDASDDRTPAEYVFVGP